MFLIFSLSLFSFNLAAEDFEYRHVEGMRYRILSIVDQSVMINGTLSHTSQILNRIAVEVTGVNDGKGEHNATYQTSERVVFDSQQEGAQTAASVFQWETEYDSVFERDRLGYITIRPNFFMPMVRNVPVFTGRSLRPGDTWNTEAHEVHDFRDAFGIQEPYRIPFRAFYQYLGEREWKGTMYPAFSVTYNVETRPAAAVGRVHPVRISSTYNMTIYWDRENGLEKAYTGTSRITFEMSDGRILQFNGRSEAELIEAEIMNRPQLAAEIAEEITRLAITDVSVREVEEGVSISLDDIRFHPDSARMLPGEQQKLDRIAEILMRYPDRDIMVSGHTALAGTPAGRMSLSQARANAVAEYLLSRNVRAADRIVTRGFGAERPVADNRTEEGMRRNRRVEITILEN
ncbi:MAG: OmpA family protein [Treponema sp.]|nr:OmpA family protein [Treponema sp.]MCL2237033.1 OmpA family protein [Treponema sp.]